MAAIAMVSVAACSNSTDSSQGPLLYSTQYSGNVSTLYGIGSYQRQSSKDARAPEFYWTRSDGTRDSLTGQRGKTVLLNFWATWCGPCTIEMPGLQDLSNKNKDSVVVLGVSVDYPGDAFSTVRNFVNSKSYRYQFIVDSAYTLFGKYLIDIQSPIPQTFLLDRQGNIRYWFTGSQQEQTFNRYIDSLR